MKSLIQNIRRIITTLRGRKHIERQYLRMHADGMFGGQTWRRQLAKFEMAVPNLQEKRILDYGCGPHGGLSQIAELNVIPYDPYVAMYSSLPWEKQFEVVFSCDVLEHMTLRQINDFLVAIACSAARYVFLNVSTREAHKTLPDGTNAHMTVKSHDWWIDCISAGLGPGFTVVLAQADQINDEVTVCFSRLENEVPQ